MPPHFHGKYKINRGLAPQKVHSQLCPLRPAKRRSFTYAPSIFFCPRHPGNALVASVPELSWVSTRHRPPPTLPVPRLSLWGGARHRRPQRPRARNGQAPDMHHIGALFVSCIRMLILVPIFYPSLFVPSPAHLVMRRSCCFYLHIFFCLTKLVCMPHPQHPVPAVGRGTGGPRLPLLDSHLSQCHHK